MGSKKGSLPLDLVEFDAYQSDQLVEYAGNLVPRMVEAGMLTAEQAETEKAGALALATKLREDPPHRDQWVRIKKRFSYGDSLDAGSLGMVRDEETETRFYDEGAHRLGVMAVGIVAWSLMDEDGEPIERVPHSCISTRRQRDCRGCDVLRDEIDEDLGKWLYAQIDDQRTLQRRSKEQMADIKSGPGGGEDS